MKSISRTGKIARLPHSIREQLNVKLLDHQPAKKLLPWLNSLTEVKIILAELDSRPISKQNLSEWKQGGHRDWLLQYHAASFLQFLPSDSSSLSSSSSFSVPAPPTEMQSGAEQTQGLPNSFTHHASRITEHATRQTPSSIQHPESGIQHPASSLTAKLLLWTQLQYISMARHIDSETDPDRKWTALRQFSNDISRLRRSTVSDDYLHIQRDWLSLSQSNTADKKEKEFWKWTQRPDIHKKLFPDKRNGLTPEALYEMETKFCLMGDGPGPEVAELMAEVRIAKKLLELRKAREALAKAKADPEYDPNRPLPDTKVRLAGMPFEELFPSIPEKPLTQTHPELDDAPDCAEPQGGASVPASRATDEVGRECQAQVGLPTAPHQAEDDSSITEAAEVEPASSDSSLPKQERPHSHNDQNELTEHATRNTSLNDIPTESSPVRRAEARRAKAGPGQSNLVQPNPATPPPDPDAIM